MRIVLLGQCRELVGKSRVVECQFVDLDSNLRVVVAVALEHGLEPIRRGGAQRHKIGGGSQSRIHLALAGGEAVDLVRLGFGGARERCIAQNEPDQSAGCRKL